jgi:hypothetical protein
MQNFSVKDTNPVTWQEVDELIDALLVQVPKDINIIAPLLRTGGIVGGILSIKMKVLTMLPVQFKYSYNPTTINQILSIPDILTDLPEPMNILLCEGNTSSGSIAKKAAEAIKEKYPQAKIYLATLTKVYGGSETLKGIEQVFYGCMTDENFKATEDEKQKLNLRSGITIFPWENVGDELSDINAAQ